MMAKRKRARKPALSSIRELDSAGPSIRVIDLARIAGGSKSWVFKLIAAGVVKGITRVGREIRIPTDEARRILKEMGHAAPA